jgi:tetratricopeptide (TPR) repeat protein
LLDNDDPTLYRLDLIHQDPAPSPLVRENVMARPAPLTVLQIRHLAGSDPPRFQVQRLSDGKTSPATDGVPNPVGFPVEGWPEKLLLPGLRWYLERFLEYPFEPETQHAELVERALKRWGEQAFVALFGGRDAGGWFDAATEEDYANLHLQVVSDEPAVLAWPWEALYDPLAGCRLAQTCQVERRLEKIKDPPKLKKLPKDRVNILLVIARPFERDVRFRSIARPLVEWAAQPEVPAYVHVLRPPTFDRLREHLHEKPGFYHLVHFDGHGAYGDRPPAAAPDRHKLQGVVQGRLVFEKADGSPDEITAEQLSDLLREGAVPAVVLNACQSAMVDDRADDPFASVAAALLRAGVRGVTAMAYSLYVSGAQQFLPAFYRRLFETGALADAVRAGRQQMRSRPERVCARGTFPLDDWLVPVLYQQEPPDLKFVKKAPPKEQAASRLPEEVQDKGNPYGFVGRDGALLELERALHRPPAGILVTGLGGVGKTTLARGFLHWLEQTGGITGDRVVWLGFADIRSAEYVLNRLGEPLFGGQFAALPAAQKVDVLGQALRQHRFLIVWDNFESARGIAGTAVAGNLPEADTALLRDLLGRLRGGATKVLITSRSPEDWLGPANRYLVRLGGLDGEERWEFANTILRDLGRKAEERRDPAFDDLMKLLGGHPLAMRVVLPRLEARPAADLAKALRENIEALKLDTTDENEARLFATLRFATEGLPAEWEPLLVLLAQHEGYAVADLLKSMAQAVDASWTPARIDQSLGALATAGMVGEVGSGLWEIHPAVTGFLRSVFRRDVDAAAWEAWSRAFVNVMGSLADHLAPPPLHEQRGLFFLCGQSFHSARDTARQLQMEDAYGAITQALAAYAQNLSDYPTAERLFQELADFCVRTGREKESAGAIHELGMVAEKRRDYDAADAWYRQSLAVEERLGNEHGTAISYHQLGRVAQERRDYDAADAWYRKALAIEERLGDEHGAAPTYHQLGIVAQERRDYDAADAWYHKSLAVMERLGDEHGAASTYHQLAMVAQERRDSGAADAWYHKSLAVEERLGNEHGAAITYHQLGMVAEERRDFDAADPWYRKALGIFEKFGDEHSSAIVRRSMERLAQLRNPSLDPTEPAKETPP